VGWRGEELDVIEEDGNLWGTGGARLPSPGLHLANDTGPFSYSSTERKGDRQR